MAVVVDTNVILDLVTEDPSWADWSERQLLRYRDEGLWINSVVFAELCVGAESADEVLAIVEDLRLAVHELSPEALYLTAQAFRRYRENSGDRTSPLPDFFIGGQAEDLELRLLTRDPARYRTYFPEVELISP